MSKYKQWSGRPPPSFDVSLIDDHDTSSESEIAVVGTRNPDSHNDERRNNQSEHNETAAI